MNIGELAKFRAGLEIPASGTAVTTYLKAADTQGLALVNSSGTSVVTVSDAGAVTAGINATHTFGNGSTATNTILEYKTEATKAVYQKFTRNATTLGYIGVFNAAGVMTDNADGDLCFASNGKDIRFGQLSGNSAGVCTIAGAWTLGPSGIASTLAHQVWGYRADGSDTGIISFDNKSTATDANGLASPVIRLQKYTNSAATTNTFVTFTINSGVSGSGRIAANGTSAAEFQTYSDRRIKENIVPLSGELKNILALNPVEFDYIDSPKNKISAGHQIGFIAQEMEQIYPDAVDYLGDTETIKSITGWSKTEARIVKAIQELSAQVTSLQAEVAALKA